MVRCWRFKSRASSDTQLPVGSWTLAATMAWVCSCGSALRLVCWRNSATATPRGVDLVHALPSPAGHRTMALEPLQGGLHGDVVGGQHLGPHERVRRQRPQHRDALGGREGGVEAPGRLGAEAPAQSSACPGVASGEKGFELLSLDLAVQAEGGTAVSPPPAGRLGRVEVVVDRPPTDTVPAGLVVGQPGVVGQHASQAGGGRLERRRPHHGRVPAGRSALVCSWCWSMPQLGR